MENGKPEKQTQRRSSSSRLPTPASAGPHLSRTRRLWTLQDRPQLLGEGGFGRVYLGQFKGQLVAIKEVAANRRRRSDEDELDRDLTREMTACDFLLNLKHPNIVQYFHFDFCEGKRLYIIMELVEGDTLADLRSKDGDLIAAQLRRLLNQVCCGLHFLHSRRPAIVHRDIKCSNIMLTRSGKIVKIVDFGLAIECADGDCVTCSLKGTRQFLAPEIWQDQRFSSKSDVFALGCALHELVDGRPPHWRESNELSICYAFCYKKMPELPDDDEALRDFYRLCVQAEANDRPTAADLLRHRCLGNQREN